MGYVCYTCRINHAQQSPAMLVSLKLLLLFYTRDQAQLDAASVSSIQVVGVVEALIQNADTLFPGGDVLYVISSPHFLQFQDYSPSSSPDCPQNSLCGLKEAAFSALSLSLSSVKWEQCYLTHGSRKAKKEMSHHFKERE